MDLAGRSHNFDGKCRSAAYWVLTRHAGERDRIIVLAQVASEESEVEKQIEKMQV
jgi:hypothetical protein